MFGFRRRRREGIRARPAPPEWARILERLVPLFRLLPEPDRRELFGHARVLLAEKGFEGAGGLEVTEEMRVATAAWGALLLLHREPAYYPNLVSVVIYPEAFLVPQVEEEGGLVTEGEEERAGESWREGTLILAWDEVLADAAAPDDGYNVTLHEFAHQLDGEDGRLDGVPPLPRELRGRWAEVMAAEYRFLGRRARLRRPTLLDPYGSESPAEFFAVATEGFFETPEALRERHPDLYRLLADYYRQDPASWQR